MEWFLSFNSVLDFIRPALDIGILAFLLYKTYDFLAKTQATQLVKAAGFLGLIFAAAVLFNFSTLQWLLKILAPGLFIAVAIVFQPELRRIVLRMGQGEFFKPGSRPRLGQLEAVVTAAELLSREKRGMLAVFPRRSSIRHIVETGTRLNAEISSSLIVTIFEFDTSLHDGAMIIQNNRILAAGCFLPLSDQSDIKRSFGTRHRAALGMSEQSDAVVLVVSEESGAMSLAFDGKMYYDFSPIEITRTLKELLDKGIRKGEPDAALPEISGGISIGGDIAGGISLNSSMDDGKE